MQKQLALKLLPLLKSEDQILSIMQKTGYDSDVCAAGIPLLKLEEKSEDQILSIMEKTGYDSDVCAAGIQALENKKS